MVRAIKITGMKQECHINTDDEAAALKFTEFNDSLMRWKDVEVDTRYELG